MPGERPPDAVYEMAIAETEDLILQRLPKHKIISRLSAQYDRLPETIKDWMREVRRRWALADSEEKPHRRDEHREMLRDLYRACYVTEDYKTCERVARQLMVLDGLHAPTQINLTTQDKPALAMTPEERSAEIEALLAKRALALKGLPAVPSHGSTPTSSKVH